MVDITEYKPSSGQYVLDDNTVINIADLLNGGFTGNNGLVVQPYTEANVKRGLQYYVRIPYPQSDNLAGGESRKIYFQTGAKQMLIKLRVFEYSGEEFSIEVFEDPAGVAGGTSWTVSNWNRVNPVASTVTVTKDVTTTDDGTPFEAAAEYFFGAANANQRDALSIPEGRERVIPPNTNFLYVITNTNGQTGRCQFFLDWYEGPTDITG